MSIKDGGSGSMRSSKSEANLINSPETIAATGFAESSPTEKLTLVRLDVERERPLLVMQEPTAGMPLWPGRWAKRASSRRKDATATLN